jgi:hypothetical protein
VVLFREGDRLELLALAALVTALRLRSVRVQAPEPIEADPVRVLMVVVAVDAGGCVVVETIHG